MDLKASDGFCSSVYPVGAMTAGGRGESNEVSDVPGTPSPSSPGNAGWGKMKLVFKVIKRYRPFLNFVASKEDFL